MTTTCAVMDDWFLAGDLPAPTRSAEDLRTQSLTRDGILGPVALDIVSQPNCPSDVLHTYAGLLLAHPNWADGMGITHVAPAILNHPNTTDRTRNRLAKVRPPRRF